MKENLENRSVLASSTAAGFSKLGSLKVQFEYASAESSAFIYANGLNQVGIRILFKPLDANNNPVSLDEDSLSKTMISLVSYSTGEALPAGWSVSDTPNDFRNQPEMVYSKAAIDNTDEYYSKIIYLSCSQDAFIETLDIGCKIVTPDGINTFVSWQNGTMKSFVSVRNIEAIIYDDKNTQLTSSVFHNFYEQTNYYFRSALAEHYFTTATIDVADGGHPLWATIEYDTTKIRFFVWSMSLAENDPNDLIDGYPIVINNVPHALTLTKIKQTQSAGPYGTTVSNCHITIYDQYGNSGKFTAFRDHDEIKVLPGFVPSTGQW